MNRQQMVEKAARAEHQHGLDVGSEHAAWDGLREVVREQYRGNARAILDAVLPQLSTVAELETLPQAAVLIGKDGMAITVGLGGKDMETVRCYRYANGRREYSARRVMHEYSALTVVWQP
jgi:hypothetical protein